MSEENRINPLHVRKEPWYKDGLHFSCTGCGKCCTGFPGYVWVTEEEVMAMVDFLKISVKEFAEKYLRTVDGALSLRETGSEYSCVFLKGTQCTVYPVRPKQCKTYPWWPENLESEEDWKEESRHCEGITALGEKVSYEVIQEQLEL